VRCREIFRALERRSLRRTTLLAAFIFAAGAHGAQVDGVRLEDRVSVGGRTLVLNGAGAREKVLLKIYVVALYLPRRAHDARAALSAAPRRIQMTMLMSVSSSEIIDALLDTMADNSTPAELAAVKPATDRLVALIRPFRESKKGDVVTLDFVAGATNLGWNGKLQGRISGAAFNRALTLIWLGNKPVQADLKRKLLGR
jgi:long-chain acyl-CoA synthetase